MRPSQQHYSIPQNAMTAQAWVALDHSVASAHKSSRECPSRAGRGERAGAGGRPRETTADRFSSTSPTPLIALEVARGGYGDPRPRVRVTIFCDDTHHFPPMRVHTGTMYHNLPAYLAPYNLTTYEDAIARCLDGSEQQRRDPHTSRAQRARGRCAIVHLKPRVVWTRRFSKNSLVLLHHAVSHR